MRLPFALPALLLPAAALAHTGAGAPSGWLEGALHPLGGVDHLLAMVAVGLWAALVGGAARVAYPLAFLGGMTAGGAIGLAGAALPGVEPLILVSVVALGALAALALRPPLTAACALLALFGLAHGVAHGFEAVLGGVGYVAGFTFATAALHVAGLALGRALQGLGRTRAARGLGALAALGGAALALG